VTATLEHAIHARTDYDIREFRVSHPDGTIRFLRTIGHHNCSGEMGEYVGITMDITERKQAEQEREKLRQLEADLAHINRVNMMGELAAALAHEIRQPIAASITSANACLRWLARDPPDLERARAAAARIEQDGNRAADVINHLRSFYKKGTPPEREIVNLKDIVREMTALLRKEAVRHSIKIHTELHETMPNVLADRVQLQQVFMNLMLNAIDAMKDTGGKLTISSRLTPEGQLIVSISDTGIGLPAENTERIFDAFHTTKPQGTGMGLAITRSIVEAHGGRVWATANQEAGATFHFTLAAKAEADA
jgi:signal transduction histidine kinase